MADEITAAIMVSVRDSLMPSWLRPVNKRLVNPVQRLWAPWLPPWAVIVHRGRRSGTEYRSPVLAWRSGSRIYVVLYYGAGAQWVRNVLAAGGAEVVRRGRRSRFADVRVVRDGSEELPRVVRALSRGLPVLVAELG
jgi:deazaflavin-dependent oxidoreductase (nitroreductase family)